MSKRFFFELCKKTRVQVFSFCLTVSKVTFPLNFFVAYVVAVAVVTAVIAVIHIAVLTDVVVIAVKADVVNVVVVTAAVALALVKAVTAVCNAVGK